jgi:hypothetical protein
LYDVLGILFLVWITLFMKCRVQLRRALYSTGMLYSIWFFTVSRELPLMKAILPSGKKKKVRRRQTVLC